MVCGLLTYRGAGRSFRRSVLPQIIQRGAHYAARVHASRLLWCPWPPLGLQQSQASAASALRRDRRGPYDPGNTKQIVPIRVELGGAIRVRGMDLGVGRSGWEWTGA